VLMRISFRTESDATRGNTAEQNTRGFRPMSAAMSACHYTQTPVCRVNEFYKKGCQEKSFPSTGGREDFRLEIQPTSL
jgi:hypothetical protein